MAKKKQNNNIEIETNSEIEVNNGNNNSKKFSIHFDHKWTKWSLITLFFLIVILLLQLTGTNKIILQILATFIPLGLALAITWFLNPVVYRLISWRLPKTLAKLITFFFSLLIGVCIIVFLIWLFINQFSNFFTTFIGDESLIKQEFLDKWFTLDPVTNKSKNLLWHILDFSYDVDSNTFSLHTNIEWDAISKLWEDVLKLIIQEKKDTIDWTNFINTLKSEYKININEELFIVNINYLKILTPLSKVELKEYFTKLYTLVSNFIKDFDTEKINSSKLTIQKFLTLTQVEQAFQGTILDAEKLGAMYQLLLSFGATASWFFSPAFLGNIIETLYNYTTASNLTSFILNRYFWTIVGVFYGLFLTIIITMFLLGGDKSFTNFLRKKVIFTKNNEHKDKIINALQRSIFGYGKGILIDMSYMFIATTTVIAIAGYAGGGETYKNAFAVLGLFMTICNLVPYIGPFIGMIPIALVGVLDAMTAKGGVSQFSSWIPMLIAIFGALLVQLIENFLVYPNLFGKLTRLHPITILMGIAIFGVIGGILGMIVAVPVIATIKSIASDVYNKNIFL